MKQKIIFIIVKIWVILQFLLGIVIGNCKTPHILSTIKKNYIKNRYNYIQKIVYGCFKLLKTKVSAYNLAI